MEAQRELLEQTKPYCELIMSIMIRTFRGYILEDGKLKAYFTEEGEWAIKELQSRVERIKDEIIKEYSLQTHPECLELRLSVL
jgi:hypothetical protein